MIIFQSNVIKVNKERLPRYISVARIFDWGGGQISFSEKKDFLRDKDTVEWSIRSQGLGWHGTWVFAKEKGHEP